MAHQVSHFEKILEIFFFFLMGGILDTLDIPVIGCGFF